MDEKMQGGQMISSGNALLESTEPVQFEAGPLAKILLLNDSIIRSCLFLLNTAIYYFVLKTENYSWQTIDLTQKMGRGGLLIQFSSTYVGSGLYFFNSKGESGIRR